MNDLEIDAELRFTANHVAELSKDVEIDPWQKAALRTQLLRHHQQLAAARAAHPARKLMTWLGGVKRLTLIGSTGAALALALVALFWGVSLSGHSTPRSAEAAQLTQALARTVPTVTAWQVTMEQERGDAAVSYACPVPAGKRLYIRDYHTYLFSGYSDRKWVEVTGSWKQLALGRSAAQCPVDFQWAFALLPDHLAHHRFTILPHRPGTQIEGIRYTAVGAHGIYSQVTDWVNRKNGLLMRLDRVLMRGSKVLERDTAVYRYETTP